MKNGNVENKNDDALIRDDNGSKTKDEPKKDSKKEEPKKEEEIVIYQ
jgi:hypothetical protein